MKVNPSPFPPSLIWRWPNQRRSVMLESSAVPQVLEPQSAPSPEAEKARPSVQPLAAAPAREPCSRPRVRRSASVWNIRCRSRWQAPSKCSECLSLSCLERDGSQSERAAIPLFLVVRFQMVLVQFRRKNLQIPFPERQYVRSFSSVLKLDRGPFEI